MSSRHQKEALRRRIEKGEVPIPPGRFETPGPYGARIWCVLCHATGNGYGRPPDARYLSVWQIDHVLDHPVPCRCGLSFLNENHLRQHVRSDRWPERAVLHGPPERMLDATR